MNRENNMNRILTGLVVCLLSGACMQAVQATTPAADPTDAILVAYPLTAGNAATFWTSMAADTVASFWYTDWATRDYIDMNTANNSYPGRNGWTSWTDAEMWVYAAADQYGLYMYVLVEDNVFVDPTTDDWFWDGTDACIDLMSSDSIIAAGPTADILVNTAWNFGLTFTSQQFQVWVGAASSHPTGMKYNFYDPAYFDWTYNDVNIADLPGQYNGMQVAVVNIDETHKAQQWFIPWTALGVTGLPVGASVAGKRFAYESGYNDVDAATATGADVKCLRWLKGDPFGPGTSVAANEAFWGNIQVADEMTDPVAQSGTKVKLHANAMPKIGVVRTELYNLKGERIAASSHIAKNTMLIQRQVLTNGKIQINKIRY